MFSSEAEYWKQYGSRIDCLMILLPILGCPNIIKIIAAESLIGIVSILVQIIGHIQKNATAAFSYKDRSVYRLVSLNLRIISRSSYFDSSCFLPWGNHWLFEDDLQWLLVIELLIIDNAE
jgi:hypothetical protein